MLYKVTNEELEAVIDDQPAVWGDLVSTSEVSVGPLVDALNDPVRGAKHQSHHDSDGESSTETLVELEVQHILKELKMKRIMEQDASSSTRSMMEAQLQQLIKVIIDSSDTTEKKK